MSKIVKAPLLAIALAASGLFAAAGAVQSHPYGHQNAGCPGMMGHGMMGCGMGQQQMGSGMMGGMRGMMGQGGMPAGNPRMHVMMMISAADSDNDQTVSFDEMMAVHRRMFDMVDENKDGRIDRDEATSMFRGEEQVDQAE